MTESNITAAFSTDLFANGCVGIPCLLLRYYTRLGLTDVQMMLIIQLLRLRQEEKNFFPSPRVLAQYVHADEAVVTRELDFLLQHGYLRISYDYDPLRDVVLEAYDLSPLFDRLSEVWAVDQVRENERKRQLAGAMRKRVADISRLYQVFEKEFGRPLSPMEVEQLEQWAEKLNEEVIVEALRRAVLNGKHNFKYIDSIILDWLKNNVRSLRDVEEYERQFQERRTGRGRRRSEKGVSAVTAAGETAAAEEENEKKRALLKKLYYN